MCIQPKCSLWSVEAVLVFRYLQMVPTILQLTNVRCNSHDLCVGYFKVSCQEVHTIPNLSWPVAGIALLKDRLYVSHHGYPRITIYCPLTFQYQQYLNCYCPSCKRQTDILQCNCYSQKHTTTFNHLGLVACDTNNCLYGSLCDNYYGNYIFKVAIGQNNTLSVWSLCARGLSITSSHNLIVSQNSNNLMEYSPDGKHIRQISLQPAGITTALHCVQLSNDQLGVTYSNPKHQFSIVSSDGQHLVQSYGGDAGYLKGPQGIAVDQPGRIFVADQNNNRILVMDSKTLSAYPLELPTNCELKGPYSLHYDAASNRLYIGEYNGARIVCCQL